MSMSLSHLNDLMLKQAFEKCIPLSGDFEITARCNLDCLMCYLRKSPENKSIIEQELKAEEIISLAKQARDAGMLYILLTGGEVFLRNDFKEIYEGISNLGLLITIYTNATLITPEIADWLALIPPRKISISIYGATPETYEKITGSKNAFNKVVNAIELLHSRGIRVELKTTWLKDNIEEFEKIKSLAANWGLQLRIVNYIFPNREAENSDPIGNRLSPEQVAQMESLFVNKKKNGISKIKSEYEEASIDKDNEIIKNLFDVDEIFKCGASKTTFWITWDGYLTPCGLMSIPKVKLTKNNFSDAILELREKVNLIPGCFECSVCDFKENCMTCPARLYAENQKFNKPAKYLCDHAKKRAELLHSNKK